MRRSRGRVRDRITLYLGGKEIQVLHLGRAHTRGDSIIYVPQDRIVYLSEIFSAGQFLFMNDGYGLDWLKTIETAAGLDADIFVPGHSQLPGDPKQSREEFLRYRQMLVDVRDSVQQAITRGATEDQAVATIQWPQYEKLRGYEFAKANGHSATLSATDWRSPVTWTGKASMQRHDRAQLRREDAQRLCTFAPNRFKELWRD